MRNLSKKILENNIVDKKVTAKKSAKRKTLEKHHVLNGEVSPTILPLAQTVKKDSSESVKTSNILVNTSSKVKSLCLYTDVPSEKSFILCDGRVIFNCVELADLLITMNEDIFVYHVTDNKNDFANWINDVFCDSNLASKISVIRNKLVMSVEIYKYMFELLKK